MKNEIRHTAHSTYRCEYHVIFAPKYRRKIIYKELKRGIGAILRKICNELKVEIIHMLVSLSPYMRGLQFVVTLKSKIVLMIFNRHAN